MLNVKFSTNPDEDLSILCLGAHPDDIEIGCGGTLLKLIEYFKNAQIFWIVFTSNDVRREKAIKSAGYFLKTVKEKDVKIFDFRDGFLPSVWTEVKDRFENLKAELTPDIIFTHHRADLHQDHRIINELTWNTFRNHVILEYEIPKYDGDMGNPNRFVPLDEKYLKQKKEIIPKNPK